MQTRVTGLGGLFFKTPQPDTIRAWYDRHLGIETPHGAGCLDWVDPADGAHRYTVWSAFRDDTTYFAPGDKTFMLNLRVADLPAVLGQLRAEDVELSGEPQSGDYGHFGWIMDPFGQKIELWQPLDSDVAFTGTLRDEGIAGIAEVRVFAADPQAWLSWYSERLGIPREGDALVFPWRRKGRDYQTRIEALQKAPARAGVKQEMLVGYATTDLAAKVADLKAAGVEVPVATSSNALLCDPDGRYLQLLQK